MNRGAVAEIAAIDPAAVIAKGDLTADGMDEEFAAFEACYGAAFGDRLHVIRGNHDAYRGQSVHPGDRVVDLPGVRLALLDTVIPRADDRADHRRAAGVARRPGGRCRPSGDGDGPPPDLGRQRRAATRPPDYFGINPDDSDALVALIARRPRDRRLRRRPHAPQPRPAGRGQRRRALHRGGLRQGLPRVVGRVPGLRRRASRRSTTGSRPPSALAWSERCRHLYQDFGIDYETYALGGLEDRCFTISIR